MCKSTHAGIEVFWNFHYSKIDNKKYKVLFVLNLKIIVIYTKSLRII